MAGTGGGRAALLLTSMSMISDHLASASAPHASIPSPPPSLPPSPPSTPRGRLSRCCCCCRRRRRCCCCLTAHCCSIWKHSSAVLVRSNSSHARIPKKDDSPLSRADGGSRWAGPARERRWARRRQTRSCRCVLQKEGGGGKEGREGGREGRTVCLSLACSRRGNERAGGRDKGKVIPSRCTHEG